MITTNNLKKLAVAAVMSGGIALAGLGLTTGSAGAAPERDPGVTIDHSDFAGPLVECNKCGRTVGDDDPVTAVNPGTKIDNGLLLPAVKPGAKIDNGLLLPAVKN